MDDDKIAFKGPMIPVAIGFYLHEKRVLAWRVGTHPPDVVLDEKYVEDKPLLGAVKERLQKWGFSPVLVFHGCGRWLSVMTP